MNPFWKTLLTGFLGVALLFGGRYARVWMAPKAFIHNSTQQERTLRDRQTAMVRPNVDTVRPVTVRPDIVRPDIVRPDIVRPAQPSSYRPPIKPPPFYTPPIKPPSYHTYNSRY